jgi:hypothetical protein
LNDLDPTDIDTVTGTWDTDSTPRSFEFDATGVRAVAVPSELMLAVDVESGVRLGEYRAPSCGGLYRQLRRGHISRGGQILFGLRDCPPATGLGELHWKVVPAP